MSKGIAIRTILLLLVGTVVAGIMIYLVYSTTRSPTLSASQCQARLVSWCTGCMNRGWTGGSALGLTFYNDCGSVLSGIGISISSASVCATEKNDACKVVGVK